MINDDQDGIESLGNREVGDKVHGALGKGAWFGASFDWKEARMRWAAVDLELLAMGTSLHELVYEMGQSRPEVVSLNGDPGGLLPGVSGSGEVVVLSGDFSAEIIVVGNVGGSFIGKEGSFFGRDGRPSFGGWLGRDFLVRSRKDSLCEGICRISFDKLSSEGCIVDALLVELK
jgi:hypothetical protein